MSDELYKIRIEITTDAQSSVSVLKDMKGALADVEAQCGSFANAASSSSNAASSSFNGLTIALGKVMLWFYALRQVFELLMIPVRIFIWANEELVKALEYVGSAVGSLVGEFAKFELAVGEQFVSVLHKAIDAGIEFDQAMRNITKLMPDFGSAAGGASDSLFRLEEAHGAAAKGAWGYIQIGNQIPQLFRDTAEAAETAADIYKNLGQRFLEMSTILPLAATELAEIGRTAAQLGIRGAEGIADFTEAVAKLAVISDELAAEVATALAKISNAFAEQSRTIPDFFTKLANAWALLATETASTVSDIAIATTRIADAGALLGLTAQQASALGAALVNMGLWGSRAGTEVNRAMVEMARNFNKVASALGYVTIGTDGAEHATEEFAERMETDFFGVFMEYIKHLRDIPSRLDQITESQELFGAIGAKAMMKLAQGYDDVVGYIDDANRGFEESVALDAMVAEAMKAVEAQLILLNNEWFKMKVTLALDLLPIIAEFITLFKKLLVDVGESDAFAYLRNTLINLGFALLDLAKTVMPFLNTIINVTITHMAGWVDYITGTLIPAIEKLDFTQMAKTVDHAWTSIETFFGNILTAVWETIKQITKAQGDVPETVNSTLKKIDTNLDSWLKKAEKWVVSALMTITEWTDTYMEGFNADNEDSYPNRILLGFTTMFDKKFLPWYTEHVAPIVLELIKITIVTVLKMVVSTLGVWFVALGVLIVAAIGLLAGGWIVAVVIAIGGLAAAALVALILHWDEDIWPWIKSCGIWLYDNIIKPAYDWGKDIAQRIYDGFVSVWTRMEAWLLDKIEWLAKKLSDLWAKYGPGGTYYGKKSTAAHDYRYNPDTGQWEEYGSGAGGGQTGNAQYNAYRAAYDAWDRAGRNGPPPDYTDYYSDNAQRGAPLSRFLPSYFGGMGFGAGSPSNVASINRVANNQTIINFHLHNSIITKDGAEAIVRHLEPAIRRQYNLVPKFA